MGAKLTTSGGRLKSSFGHDWRRVAFVWKRDEAFDACGIISIVELLLGSEGVTAGVK